MIADADSANKTIRANPRESAAEKFLWCVRRELWEYRSLYLAPLIVAAIALAGFMISSFVGIWEPPLRLNPEQPQSPYDLVAGLLMFVCIVVNVFYSLDALHGERRDRSILFWKSLPVSDATTVLSKASIPLVVVPFTTFAVTLATQWIMLLWSTLIVSASGGSVATLWTKLSFVHMSLLLLYHLVTVHALWPIPVYSWLLLVSGWARRAVLLWAVLPVLVIGGLEGLFFRTWRFPLFVFSRLMGMSAPASHEPAGGFPMDPSTHLTPGLLLSSPGFWLGLIFSAICIALAIRLRRSRGPI